MSNNEEVYILMVSGDELKSMAGAFTHFNRTLDHILRDPKSGHDERRAAELIQLHLAMVIKKAQNALDSHHEISNSS